MLASNPLRTLVSSASPPGLSCISVLKVKRLPLLINAITTILFNVLTSILPPEIIQTTFSPASGLYFPLGSLQ